MAMFLLFLRFAPRFFLAPSTVAVVKRRETIRLHAIGRGVVGERSMRSLGRPRACDDDDAVVARACAIEKCLVKLYPTRT